MFFITESGSKYEVDEDNKKIRRISNSNEFQPTLRQGNNEWREYAFLSDIKVGNPVLISWTMSESKFLAGCVCPSTLTSHVIEIC